MNLSFNRWSKIPSNIFILLKSDAKNSYFSMFVELGERGFVSKRCLFLTAASKGSFYEAYFPRCCLRLPSGLRARIAFIAVFIDIAAIIAPIPSPAAPLILCCPLKRDLRSVCVALKGTVGVRQVLAGYYKVYDKNIQCSAFVSVTRKDYFCSVSQIK